MPCPARHEVRHATRSLLCHAASWLLPASGAARVHGHRRKVGPLKPRSRLTLLAALLMIAVTGAARRPDLRIGCHISVSQGFDAAVAHARELEAQCFQYFTKSPRMLRFSRKLNVEDAERGRLHQAEWDLVSLGHAPYLINLSAPEADLRRASIEALVWDLEVAHARGTFAVVVHCGKHKGAGVEPGIQWMREALQQVLAEAPADVLLLLENTAGAGSEIGSTVDELLQLVDGIAGPDRLGFCLDTQHAFAAGILKAEDPGSFAGFRQPEFRSRLQAVHLNDSLVPFAAHRDRHAKIGKGQLGAEGIQRILTLPEVQDLPFFLETPVDDEAEYGPEMALCRQLAGMA
jgi:deoxyribonuclease-4